MIAGDPVYPDVVERLSARRDLYRTAATSILAERDAGRLVDPHRLEWAETVLSLYRLEQQLTEVA